MLMSLFQKYSLWTFLILSGLAGLAMGNLGATLFAGFKSPADSLPHPAQTNVQQAPPAQTLTGYQPILQRNIFNAAQSAGFFDEAPASHGRQSTSKWSLIGTLSGGKIPLATLQDNNDSATYALNDELPDGAVVVAVERNRVVLRYPGGKSVSLELDEVTQQGSTIPADRKEPPSASTSVRINELGNNRWLIPSLIAENARENIGQVLKQAHAVPYLEEGQTTGFELQMLRKGSLLDKIGLEKGDILRRINNHELNSPEKALQIFGQLRHAKQFSIDLERRGKAMTFAYEIR